MRSEQNKYFPFFPTKYYFSLTMVCFSRRWEHNTKILQKYSPGMLMDVQMFLADEILGSAAQMESDK